MEIEEEDHGRIIVVDDTETPRKHQRKRRRERGPSVTAVTKLDPIKSSSPRRSSVIIVEDSPHTTAKNADEDLARRLQLEEQEKFAFELQRKEYKQLHEQAQEAERRQRQAQLGRQEQLDQLYAQSLTSDDYQTSSTMYATRNRRHQRGHVSNPRVPIPYGFTAQHQPYGAFPAQPEVGDDYESLLALDDTIVKEGIQPQELDLYTMQQTVKAADVEKFGTCVICLGEFEEGETIRRLQCLCIFHKDCVDHHFKENKTCPICRKEVMGR